MLASKKRIGEYYRKLKCVHLTGYAFFAINVFFLHRRRHKKKTLFLCKRQTLILVNYKHPLKTSNICYYCS